MPSKGVCPGAPSGVDAEVRSSSLGPRLLLVETATGHLCDQDRTSGAITWSGLRNARLVEDLKRGELDPVSLRRRPGLVSCGLDGH